MLVKRPAGTPSICRYHIIGMKSPLRKIVLSPQWDFLYWQDVIFILHQPPDSRETVFSYNVIPLPGKEVLYWNGSLVVELWADVEVYMPWRTNDYSTRNYPISDTYSWTFSWLWSLVLCCNMPGDVSIDLDIFTTYLYFANDINPI